MIDVGSPFLKIGMTLAIFRLLGYIPELIARFKIFASAGANMEEESLTNLIEKLSKPVELVFLRDFMVLVISDSDV